MAGFDNHSRCTCCREKGQGPEPWVMNEEREFCALLSKDKKEQLATLAYNLKWEKKDKKTDTESATLVHLSSVLVLGPASSVSSNVL